MQSSTSRIVKVVVAGVLAQLAITITTVDFSQGWKVVATSTLSACLYAGLRALENSNSQG